ncbi:MAG: chromate transporter [Oscillospiraceae bacterium]|nr:chromate transporter [Oscillospiraceae bacterium]
MILLRLFWEFFKTGLFAVGGGMATLPFLYDMAEKTGWFTAAQLADMIAVSESTPGPIGVNMATYVGFHSAGIPGAVIATLGLITPEIIIILIIARVLQKFRQNKIVDAAFYGLRPCSVGLIAAAGLLVVKVAMFHLDKFEESGVFADLLDWSVFNWKALALAAVLIVLTRWVKPAKKLHPIFFILGSAVIGIVFNFTKT